MAKYSANPGLLSTSLDAVSLAAAFGAGSEFAIIIPSHGTPNISWTTSFAGGNPGSITVLLEGSIDGTTWFTIDTSTSITGELRSLSGSFKFVRANNSAVTVGAGITLTVSFVYSNTTTQPAVQDSIFYSEANLNIPTVSLVEEVLKTVTIPGGTLNTGNFIGFQVFATIQAAANVNAKTGRLRIGGLAGTVICATAADVTSGNRFQYDGDFLVNSSTSLSVQAESSRSTGTSFLFGVSVNSLNFANGLDVTITGETTVATADLALTSMRVVLLRRKV